MIDVRKYHNVSKQAHALQELERLASEWTDLKSILVMHDSILYECYEDLSKATIWFDGLHYDWLRSNKELITEGKSSRIFRVMMVPYPYIISNNFKRKALMEFIVLNIHMQLWHGIICCVKFFDPRVTPIRNVITKLNIAVFPRIRSLFDFPDYYHAEDFKKNVITKAAFDRRQCCTRSMLLDADNKTALIMLFYDEKNFWPESRESWHWKQMRRFFI